MVVSIALVFALLPQFIKAVQLPCRSLRLRDFAFSDRCLFFYYRTRVRRSLNPDSLVIKLRNNLGLPSAPGDQFKMPSMAE